MGTNPGSLEEKIENIREKISDRVDLGESPSDKTGYVHNLSFLNDELRELLTAIEKTKTDLVDIQPKHLSENKIPEASSQLDQVVKATEDAASKIMDSAEEISDLAATVDGKISDQLMAISTNIFEASSFQDITGQRVTKVVTTLKYIEEKLLRLAEAIGDTDSHIRAEQDRENIDAESDDNLLQGPQSEQTRNDQDAIDALFDSFD